MTYAVLAPDQADLSFLAGGYVFPSLSAVDLTFPSDAVIPDTIAVVTGLGEVTNFGDPLVGPTICTPSGWETTNVGRPTSSTFVPSVTNIAVSATALSGTTFGAASVGTQVNTQATGQATTYFGEPSYGGVYAAQSLPPTTVFGIAGTALGARPAGTYVVSFGTPVTSLAMTAGGTYRATRWGSPRVAQGTAYPFPASSVEPTAAFGLPFCAGRYRALHIYPEIRFGKPLMLRNPPC